MASSTRASPIRVRSPAAIIGARRFAAGNSTSGFSVSRFDFAAAASQVSSMTDTMNFAPEYDVPLEYMRRTREYYLALGYDNPYRWAHYVDAPFQPLKKPLKHSTLALITTAAPYQSDKGDQGPGALYNAAAKFYAVYSGDTSQDHDTRISHIGYD